MFLSLSVIPAEALVQGGEPVGDLVLGTNGRHRVDGGGDTETVEVGGGGGVRGDAAVDDCVVLYCFLSVIFFFFSFINFLSFYRKFHCLSLFISI